jgi:hypothetical protein
VWSGFGRRVDRRVCAYGNVMHSIQNNPALVAVERLFKPRRRAYVKKSEKVKANARQFYRRNRDRLLLERRNASPEMRAAMRANNKKWRTKFPAKMMLILAKRRAKLACVPFSITERDIVIPEMCPVLNIPLKHGEGKYHAGSPTLDRLIPSLGYVPGNVFVISHRANTLKGDGTPQEHVAIAQWINAMRLLHGV